MDYSLNVERMRMQQVVLAIDGGSGPGRLELRNAERFVLATLLLPRPSFYLVGSDLQLAGPVTGFVTVDGQAVIGTISDGQGTVVVDNMTVGVDTTPDAVHDYEIVLDNNNLEDGHQVTITYAVIEHG
jgi:hypothetical protein